MTERLGVHYVAEPRPRRYDPNEHLSRRHLPGKHDQKDHGHGHGGGSVPIVDANGDSRDITVVDAERADTRKFAAAHRDHETSLTDREYDEEGNLISKTVGERTSVYWYSKQDYEEINTGLRTGDKKLLRSQKDNIANVRSAIAKNTVKQDVLVTRRMSTRVFGGDPEKAVGTVVADKAFLSTSLLEKPPPGSNFDTYRDKDVVMTIRVPKGTNALYIGKFSYWKKEHELLLGDSTQLAILGAKEEGGKWTVDAQVVS